MATVWIEACVALVCLGGLMCGDPGVVKRTPQTIAPMPDHVRIRLERDPTGKQLASRSSGPNLSDPQLGTYCVRCLLWRNPRGGQPDWLTSR